MSRWLALAFVWLAVSGAGLSREVALAVGQDAPGAVNRNRDGVALEGYDPVAYFIESRAVRGDAAYEYTWQGARYRFASAANRDRFAREPERFAPQYGGFCAYAVSRGYTAPIDPEAWAVVGGKLYLNYSMRVRRTWEEDVPGNIRRADANWPALRASTK